MRITILMNIIFASLNSITISKNVNDSWNPFVRNSVVKSRLQSTVSSDDISDDYDNNAETAKFVNVPKEFRHFCVEKPMEATIFGASDMQNGLYHLFIEDLDVQLEKSTRSNHYPMVQFVQPGDPRLANSNINSAFLFGSETNIIFFSTICVFVNDHKVRCNDKDKIFPGLRNIETIATFGVQSYSSKKWLVIADSKEVVGGTSFVVRHVIEDRNKEIKNFTLTYQSDANVVYLRSEKYVEGYSMVKSSFYKFIFLTNKEVDDKSEALRMLWGANQEFLGCPKPLCHASVVDTVVRLKDNFTYIFVGKYYWRMEEGVMVSDSKYIDDDNPTRLDFPYLATDIDASFYDIESDIVYFLKGDYVYSYTKTDKIGSKSIGINGDQIGNVFRGIPSNMNAAFYYRPNATVYFFRDYNYWAYDMKAKSAIRGYPRLISDFEGLPPNIDEVMSDNRGNYYVFSGTFFSKFTDNSFKIGHKFEFVVSNVDFFRCPSSYFKTYAKFKHDMENRFSPVSANVILHELSKSAPNSGQSATESESSDKKNDNKKTESFLNTFSNLILFGPFLYQPFLARKHH